MKGYRSNRAQGMIRREMQVCKPTTMRPVAVCLALSMALTVPLSAFASKQSEAAALAILQAAKKHYSNKSFIKAAQMFATAYEVSGNPAYLFNAGRAYQRGYKLDEAEKHFKRCLSLVKDKKNPMVHRAKIHLQEIQEARSAIAAAVKTASGSSLASSPPKPKPQVTPPDASKKPDKTPSETKPAPAKAPQAGADAAKKSVSAKRSPKPSWKRYTSWGLIAGGGVTGAVAAWMMASATNDKNALQDDVKRNTKGGKVVMSKADYDQEVSSINSRIYTGYGLFAAGIALVGTGAWMMAGPSKTKAEVAISPMPGGVRFGFAARF